MLTHNLERAKRVRRSPLSHDEHSQRIWSATIKSIEADLAKLETPSVLS